MRRGIKFMATKKNESAKAVAKATKTFKSKASSDSKTKKNVAKASNGRKPKGAF